MTFSRSLRITAILAAALVAIVTGILTTLLSGDAIYSGVRMSGIELGGLTVEQAKTRLAVYAAQSSEENVLLKYGDETMETTVAEIGGSIDIQACVESAHRVGREGSLIRRLNEVVSSNRQGMEIPLIYTFDSDAASALLSKVALEIDRDPVDARLVVEDGSVTTVREKPGIKLDAAASLDRISETVNAGLREAELVVMVTPAKVTARDFEEINGVIASYSTPFNPAQRDRTHNLRLAAAAANGTLLKPGDVFSYNKIVGQRSKERGYRDAPMFVKGEIEAGLGGGVCQVSTTIYNAALLSDLEIVRRSPHSRPVTYTSVGRDAAVAYPNPDLHFKNNGDTPIYVMASVGSRTVDVSFLGKKQDDKVVEIVTSGHKVIAAPSTQTTDPELAPGTREVRNPGRNGHRVSVYRIVKSGGVEVKRELISNDYYRPENRVIVVGPPQSP